MCRRLSNPRPTINRFLNYWKTSERFSWPNQEWYTGTGLHYHPDCKVTPLAKQLCGNDGRPDYQDTIGYDQEICPGLLNGFGRFVPVRCKITCLSGRKSPNNRAHDGWHHDETPFEALRVIIPLSSDGTYMFQMDNESPVSLMTGNAYAFDQSVMHRVFSTTRSEEDRIHLVMSFVTWFDRTADGWQPNEFCGKTHPLDLFDLVEL